jgi:hypothetical protein
MKLCAAGTQNKSFCCCFHWTRPPNPICIVTTTW